MKFVYLNPQHHYATQPFDSSTSIAVGIQNGEGATCTSAFGDAAKLVREYVVPLFEETRHTWAPAMKPLIGNIRGAAPGSESYAQLYPPENPRPSELSYELPELKAGGGMKKADFERAKRNGDIVLQERLIAKTRCVVTPGIRRDDLSSKASVRLQRGRGGSFPRDYNNTCNVTGILLKPGTINRSATPHFTEEQNYVAYDRYLWSGNWEYPSVASVLGMMEQVQYTAIAVPQNAGVITAALAEANNQYWDILTEIAELADLVRYILDGLKEILNLTKTFKKMRRDLLKAGATLSELSSLWLQYRYAVMPIVYSVEDMMKYLTAHSSVYLTTRKRVNSFVPPPEIPGWTVEGEISVQQRCFLKRKYDLSIGDSVFLTVNPLLTGWEKVTFSFVIDWALNVGNILAALVPPSGIEREATLYSNQVPKGTQVVYASADHIGMTVTIQTGVYRAYPITALANIGLTFDPELNLVRQLDAVALSWQLFLKQYFAR